MIEAFFMKHIVIMLLLAAAIGANANAAGILFDHSLNETAGNADWIIDDTEPVPSPAQSGITSGTAESYWKGGISAWGVACVKQGHTVTTLVPSDSITYGRAGNPRDLSKFKVFVICEPQDQFTANEKKAIFAFVRAGGGLFMVADHYGSDRDSDGWDSPRIFNDLGAKDSFGIWFNVSGQANNNFSETSSSHSSGDSIVSGAYGTAGSLKFSAGTAITMYTACNATVKKHFWRSSSSSAVMCATARFGAGKVVGIGDSSPADDGTGTAGNTLYNGWGVAGDAAVFMNATLWLAAAGSSGGDVTAPSITAGPAVSGITTSGATITWTTNEAANATIQYGTTTSYGSTASDAGYVTGHSLALSGLAPGTTYHYRVGSTDAAGNGPTYSADGTFATAAAPAGPAVVINEVNEQNGSTPGYYNEYVELHNTTASVVSLSGWTLRQYGSAYATTFASGASIPAHGYYVVARGSAGSWSAYYSPAYNVVGSIVLNGGEAFSLRNGSGALVDSTVTFGTPYYCRYRAAGSTGTLAASWYADAGNGTAAAYGTPGAANPAAKGGWSPPGGADTPSRERKAAVFPNPFRGTTRISCQSGSGRPLSLDIYNVAGQRVRTIVRNDGACGVDWDGRDDGGGRLAAGVYVYRLAVGPDLLTGKVQLVR
ncbi:MAG: lamin tail domain-containing protein [Candidatus Edwardsbacteria bacterium]|jgi:hypothetical protein|nr:lamin tail domain-containing protein [Candidatus Edwardsbacteria bacterium]